MNFEWLRNCTVYPRSIPSPIFQCLSNLFLFPHPSNTSSAILSLSEPTIASAHQHMHHLPSGFLPVLLNQLSNPLLEHQTLPFLLLEGGHCPAILPPLTHIAKFLPVDHSHCPYEHADISSILQKNTTFDPISPSSCPISQLPFAAKSSKVITCNIFSTFLPSIL